MNGLEEVLYADLEDKRADIVDLLVNSQASGQNSTRFGESALKTVIGQDETTMLRI